MKKIILSTFLFCATVAFSQTPAGLAQVMEDNAYSWVAGKMIENHFTFNVPDAMWAEMKKSGNAGLKGFSSIGLALVNYFDLVHATEFNAKKCGGAKSNIRSLSECEGYLQQVKDKLSITVNAKDAGITPENYKLLANCLAHVGMFLNGQSTSNDSRGVMNGWRPKGNTLKIIVNAENKTGVPTVAWSKEGTTATISMPIAKETTGWADVLKNGLQKGGK